MTQAPPTPPTELEMCQRLRHEYAESAEPLIALIIRARAQAVGQYKARLNEGFYVICKRCGHPDTRSEKCEHEEAL